MANARWHLTTHRMAERPKAGESHGRCEGPLDARVFGGYFVFDSSVAALLVSLLDALQRAWQQKTESGSTTFRTACPQPVIGWCELIVQTELGEPHIAPCRRVIEIGWLYAGVAGEGHADDG